MHLVRGMSSLNTKKKKKSKLTLSKIAKYQEQLKEHNKFMKRIGCNTMDLQEFIAYCQGNYKPKKQNKEFKPLKQSDTWVRETANIPSRDTKESFAPATKKESMQYTGERKLVGIAMMHKSNLVPVFADDNDKTGQKQATEIAQMRRN
tara:strand:+ start:702 stop:1145 length:444 start_codon:yes stop_codon:yes gene_type:complete